MSQLIEVAFKGNRREFFLWEADDTPPRAAAVVVDADRGEDLGLVHSSGDEAEMRSAKVPHGLRGAPPEFAARRLATADDVARLADVRSGDDEARHRAMERVKANALVMKITDAEWQWDRKKLSFYFTAEKRVDFRTLVRELASMFRTRIELKQIGVRDEAKRLDGVGRSGSASRCAALKERCARCSWPNCVTRCSRLGIHSRGCWRQQPARPAPRQPTIAMTCRR